MLHKASLDFITVVKGKETQDRNQTNLEEKVAEIRAQHDDYQFRGLE